MKNISLACVLGILGVMANSFVVKALDFNFSFEGEGTHPDFIGVFDYPGRVTGLIQGLKDNAQSMPSRIIINENTLGVPVGTVIKDIHLPPYGFFTVKNGKIIGVENIIYSSPLIDHDYRYARSLNNGNNGQNYLASDYYIFRNYK